MPIIAVSGHARKVGKTSVAQALLAALSQYEPQHGSGQGWTALKVSLHWHSDARETPAQGGDGKGEIPDCVIVEEESHAGTSDTSRFLKSGARRAFWVRVREDRMAAALPSVQALLATSPFAIVEGNSILDLIPADFRILVLNYGVGEFKESARRLLPLADALVAIRGDMQSPESAPWRGIDAEAFASIPLFETSDPKIIPPALIDLIRTRFPFALDLRSGDH